MKDRRAPRQRFKMNLVRLEDALHLERCLLADALADCIRILHEHIARHLVADAEEHKKTDEHHRQYRY